ncbi:S8 family serine peptidase [Streptomyces sp. NPDC088746]|uniref:S8 family serine peptidase n=1 Tax=Streptomyces sp. NPDC088746 TaxID=3365885 RepID=UPI0038305AB8
MYLPRSSWRTTATWAAAAAITAAVLTGPAPAFAQPNSAEKARPGSAFGNNVQVDAAVLDTVGKGKESTFFVTLKKQADLSAARDKRTHEDKAKSAFASLRKEAARSQTSIRSYLDKAEVGYEPYWIANALKVTGDEQLVAELAARGDVESIRQERVYKLDEVEQTAVAGPSPNTTADPEWGIKDVKADQVWSQYDDRGESIVIANIDSGVQYDHPALVGNYRGNLGNGTFSHDYNWYDPTGQCGTAGNPCDNNGHGTHTMGTMVGADGVGVAPGAQWIAAKGCESSSCSDSALLAAGQWILAPTDHNGLNPKPELAPDIVNNSWGGGDTTFYQDIVEAWNAAGIFEAFAAGNDGNGTTCSTAHAPGSQAPSYGVGAYDVNGKIANFSGFGPSLVDGSAKPNISAPGVNIRSTWPGSTYKAINGTSMATPHVAGAVALLWSAAPSLIGKIDETRAILNDGAIDVDDTHCGGSADMNNVWGEGKLDILASVDAAPRSAATVTGTVADKATGKPLSGMTVKAQAGTAERSVTTAADGTYKLNLNADTYTVEVSGYGYATTTQQGFTVATGEHVTKNVALDAVPVHTVSGTVLDVTGKPLPGAMVRFVDAPLDTVTSDSKGIFRFPSVAEGSFSLTATPAAPVLCNGVFKSPVTIDGDETVTAGLPNRTDAAGNSCAPASYKWVKGTTTLALAGDENATAVKLPFPVSLYGVPYTTANVTTNGLVNFLEPRLGDYTNTALPSAGKPNGVIAALWDDLTIDSRARVKTATTGTTGHRTFAIVWENAAFVSAPSSRVTFEVLFDEATGAITLQYQGIAASSPETGAKATIGIENQAGTDALQYSFNEAVLTDLSAIRITTKATS